MVTFGFCPQPPQWNWLYRRSPRSPRPPRSPWGWMLLGAFVVSLLPLVLPPKDAPELRTDALEVEEGAVLVTTEHEWGNKPVRRIIPPSPPEGSGWERVPCREKWMHAINGACWAKVEGATPPCSSGLYEHKGGCFSPIVKGQRPPSSIWGAQ